jgi:hypothetical protein
VKKEGARVVGRVRVVVIVIVVIVGSGEGEGGDGVVHVVHVVR